jgi:hypothetical protein
MVLRIERTDRRDSVVFFLSGRIEPQDIAELQAHFAEQRQPITLDLKEVRLVDREVVATFARWDTDGIKLDNCPAYLCEWIAKVQNRK